MMAVAWKPGQFPRDGTKEVEIVTKIDQERYQKMLESLML